MSAASSTGILLLRRATPADELAIRALVRASNLNPLGIHWQHFLVAEAGGQIAGIGQVKQHFDGSRELASIGVRPEYRGRGIARHIIDALLGIEQGVVYLTCRSHMEPFYVRFGFRRVVSAAGLPPYFRLIYVLLAVASRLAAKGPPGIIMRRP